VLEQVDVLVEERLVEVGRRDMRRRDAGVCELAVRVASCFTEWQLVQWTQNS
jgi:hypothetical protein